MTMLDDGRGMTEPELSIAMRLGSRSPLEERDKSDLGRFGLGLKTASFSQSRRLMVASMTGPRKVTTREWDLDYVLKHNEWRVLLSLPDSATHDRTRLEKLARGTFVRWEVLDHIVGEASVNDEAARTRFYAMVEEVRQHLGMVFHRYISERPALSIFINGDGEQHLVRAWDPFCLQEKAKIITPEEPITLFGALMSVTGFVLPHRDRFSSPEAFVDAGGPDGWIAHEGFFVYRNRRLLLPGGWLGLGRDRPWSKEEHYKLARIRLDIPNALDRLWQIDVKKGVARPPAAIRAKLTDLAENVRAQARRVFAHRGQYRPRVTPEPVIPVWIAGTTENGKTMYRINREHSAVADCLNRDSIDRADLRRLLRLFESNVPVQQVWLDIAERPDQQADPRSSFDEKEIAELYHALHEALTITRSMSAEAAEHEILRTEPFNLFPELVARLSAEHQASR